MRKIRLDLEALDVESFDVTPNRAPKGTMVGHELTANTDCGQETCAPTCHVTWCQESCAGTCLTDCWGACGGGGTGNCQIHTNTCTQGERCYSRPDTNCAPTDYLSCDPC
jgi:hypothetical protein